MASRRSGTARRKKDIADNQKERRRALQARHRATLASLFDSLRNVVCPLEKTPAKWKILHRAREFLQQQEACLEELLSMKEIFLVDTDESRSLAEVREEYRRLHCQRSWRSTEPSVRPICSPSWRAGRPSPGSGSGSGPGAGEDSDISSEEDLSEVLEPSPSSPPSIPNIQEFEGYLLFYRQTVERLLGSGVLSPDQTGLAVVSQAVSALWRSLSPERRATFQPCGPEPSPQAWEPPLYDPPLCWDPPGCPPQDGPGASGPPAPALEEDLLQDAYDVVQKELDLSSGDSPKLDAQQQRELYSNIMAFAQTKMAAESSQGAWPASDYEVEAGFLRCTETFDDL